MLDSPSLEAVLKDIRGDYLINGDYICAYERLRMQAESDQSDAEYPVQQSCVDREQGIFWMALGDFENARFYCERAVNVRRRELGADDPLTAQAELDVAYLAYADGEDTTAQRLSESAMAVLNRTWGTMHPETAVGYALLSRIRLDYGDCPGAKELAEQASCVFAESGNEYCQAHVFALIAWARALVQEQHPEEALDKLRTADAAYFAGIAPPHRAREIISYHRMLAFLMLGDTAAAEAEDRMRAAFADERLELRIKLLSVNLRPEAPCLPDALTDLSRIAVEARENGRSRRFAVLALAAVGREGVVLRRSRAEYQLLVAEALMRCGRYADAGGHYQRAADLCDETDARLQSRILCGSAGQRFEMGEDETAIEDHDECLEQLEAADADPGRFAEADRLAFEVYDAMSQTDDALSACEQSVSRMEMALESHHLAVGHVQLDLARALAHADKSDQALSLYEGAIDTLAQSAIALEVGLQSILQEASQFCAEAGFEDKAEQFRLRADALSSVDWPKEPPAGMGVRLALDAAYDVVSESMAEALLTSPEYGCSYDQKFAVCYDYVQRQLETTDPAAGAIHFPQRILTPLQEHLATIEDESLHAVRHQVEMAALLAELFRTFSIGSHELAELGSIINAARKEASDLDEYGGHLWLPLMLDAGDAYFAAGMFQQAHLFYTDAARIAAHARVGGRAAEFRVMVRQARLCLERYNVPDVQEILERLWKANNEQARNIDPLNLALLDECSGDFYSRWLNFAEAQASYENAIAGVEQLAGSDDPALVALLIKLATIHIELGDFPDANSALKRATEIHRTHGGLRLRAWGDLAYWMGRLRLAEGNPDLALLSFETSRQTWNSTGSGSAAPLSEWHVQDDPDESMLTPFQLVRLARVLVGAGEALWQKGVFGNAIGLYERAEGILSRLESPDYEVEAAFVRRDLGSAYVDLSRLQPAHELFSGCLETFRNRMGEQHPEVAATLSLLADVETQAGQFQSAIALLDRSKEICQAVLPYDHPLLYRVHVQLADTWLLQDQFERALPYLQEMVAAAERPRNLPFIDPLVARCSCSLLDYSSRLEQRAGQATKMNTARQAEALFEFVSNTPISRTTLSKLDPQRAGVLRDFGGWDPHLADVLLARAKYPADTTTWPETLTYLSQARRILHEYAGGALRVLAEDDQLAFLSRRDFNHFSTAMSLALLHADDPATAIAAAEWACNRKGRALSTLTRRFVSTDQLQDLLPLLEQRLQQVIQPDPFGDSPFLKRFIAVLNELAQATTRRRISVERLSNSFNAPESESSLAVAEYLSQSERAAVLWDQMRSDIAKAHERARMEVDGWIYWLGQDESSPSNAFAEARLQESIQRLTALETSIQAMNLDPDDTSANWMVLDQLRVALPPDAVLIDFSRIRSWNPQATTPAEEWMGERYVASIVPPVDRDSVRLVDLGKTEELDDLVGQFLADIAERRTGWLASGENLAKRLLEPIREYIHEGSKLIICPDGEFWRIPWGALPIGESRYLVERSPVLLLVGPEALLGAPRPRDPGPPLVIGNPAFGGIGRSRWGDLPHTRREFQAACPLVAEFSGYSTRDVLTLEYSNALKALVIHAASPSVLYFATHGFFDTSQKNLSIPGDMTAEGALMLQRHPLLRCGIVLAGANEPTSSDSGLLTGLEIADMDLRGTELVVLSACETAVGVSQQGEGVASLRQAFQIAGAANIVASLWKVDDARTADLMTEFMEQALWQKQTGCMDYAVALQQAQIGLLRGRVSNLNSLQQPAARGPNDPMDVPEEKLSAAKKRYEENQRVLHPFYWAAFTITGAIGGPEWQILAHDHTTKSPS